MANVDSASTGETTKRKRPEVATKEYIDASGTAVEIEKATGIRYTSLPDKDVCMYQIPGAVPGSPATMLALFGASTLGTNTASSNRTKAENAPEDAFATDAKAVEDRLTRIEQDSWGASATGGGGFAIDVDLLYQAVCEAAGKVPGTPEADWKAKVSANAAQRKELRNHSKVGPVYERLVRERRNAGKDEKDLDSLMD